MKTEVKRITMAELEGDANLPHLMAEYASESAITDIGPYNPQFAAYRAMEAAGLLQVHAAYSDGLVGFLLLLLPILPHFGRKVAVTESFFVAAAHRKSGAGTLLRQVAEAAGEEAGGVGILMSAPAGGQLAQVLPHVGYRHTNSTFYKAFK